MASQRWNAAFEPCSGWPGLKCTNDERNAIEVNIQNTGLRGEIPDVGGLKYLKSLVLANNDIEGTLPSSLALLTELVTIDLRGNPKLRGELPAGLSEMTALRFIDIRGTQINPPFPKFGENVTL